MELHVSSTRKEILRAKLEMTVHNLYCYSQNLLMDSPKLELEQEWHNLKNAVKILEDVLKELAIECENGNSCNKEVFV